MELPQGFFDPCYEHLKIKPTTGMELEGRMQKSHSGQTSPSVLIILKYLITLLSHVNEGDCSSSLIHSFSAPGIFLLTEPYFVYRLSCGFQRDRISLK